MRGSFYKIILKGLFACLFMGGLNNTASAQYDKIVAADGSGDFTTIQAAILAAPLIPTIPYKIYIKNGIYNEKVTINRTFITLVGESVTGVVIRWDDYYLKVPNLQPKSTATVTINANDVVMINITVENRSANTMDSPQALALNVNRDRCAFKNCRFIGGHDTVSTDRNGTRQYFRNCYIDGNTDFIYGASVTLFDSCIIFPRDRIDGGSGGYITAANTPINQPYGYVFRNCIIPENRGVTQYTLGRPWGNDGGTADADKARNKTVFINTIMGSSIRPAGWSVWNSGTNTSFITYAEYNSRQIDGSPVDVSSRVSWSQQLTPAEAATYTMANVFTNSSGTWDPCTISPDFCDAIDRKIALSNFRAKKGATTVTISGNINWPIEDVVAGLYRSLNGTDFEKIGETILSLANYNFVFTDDLPAPGGTYYYKMIAAKPGFETFTSEIITVSGPIVVPLKLTSFTAIREAGPGQVVKLIWRTTGEINALMTAVERSGADNVFKEIGTVAALNTPGNHEYTFFDRNLNFDRAYYRLRLVDASGDFTYSEVKEVSLSGATALTVYPNPVVRGEVMVRHPKAGSSASIAVQNAAGATVLNRALNTGSVGTMIDFSLLKKGIYMLCYRNEDNRQVLKIVVP